MKKHFLNFEKSFITFFGEIFDRWLLKNTSKKTFSLKIFSIKTHTLIVVFFFSFKNHCNLSYKSNFGIKSRTLIFKLIFGNYFKKFEEEMDNIYKKEKVRKLYKIIIFIWLSMKT